MATEEILEFEKKADAELEKLGLWGIPMRSVVSALYVLADNLVTGGSRLAPGAVKRPAQAMRLISNLSYIAEQIAICPPEKIGRNIDDAISAVDTAGEQGLISAIAYGTLSELMPAVHRRQLNVENSDKGFKLTYPSDAAQQVEARDIVLSELALAFESGPSRTENWMLDRLYVAWPAIPPDVLGLALVNSRARYRTILKEAPLLPLEAYPGAFGFTRADFEGFRVGLLAMADFCLGMANAAARRASVGDRQVRLHQRERREWISPLLKESMLFGMAAGLGNVSVPAFVEIAKYFTIDAISGKFPHAGDGFWPPLMRFKEGILFSPHALRSMLTERNLLYALNELDRDRFDNLVSEHLEPALLDDAAKVFAESNGFKVISNVNWSFDCARGEIDLLVVEDASSTALALQAKAAIQPQGARMTRRIEDRTLEAATQVKSFEKLTDHQRDEICSKAAGIKTKSLTHLSAILSRSCFGTHRAWSQIGDATPLNLLLLKGAMARLRKAEAPLADLPAIAEELLDEIVGATASQWQTEELPIFGAVIEKPSLRIDEAKLADIRHKIFIGRAV